MLDTAADLCGADATTLPSDQALQLQRALSSGLDDAWQRELWPFLIRREPRYLRDLYSSATTYAAGAEVYSPALKKHYLALRATTGDALTSLAYWAEAKTSYSADDYAAATAYVAGDQVYYAATDTCYQAHTAGTGNLPTDTAYWGELVPFVPYVAFEQTGETAIGDVIGITDKDPGVYTATDKIPYVITHLGVQLLETWGKVWIEFRLRPPQLTGAAYSSTTAYAVGDQVYFTTTGHLYTCLAITTAGESPASAAAKWSVVEIPLELKEYVSHWAYCRWLTIDGQGDKAAAAERHKTTILARLADRWFRQQGQVRRTQVLTR